LAWQKISHWAKASRPLAELRAAYRRTDLVAVDLDECLFPGFSQKELGLRLMRRLLRRPLRPGDRRFLPQLAWGAFRLGVSQAKMRFGWKTPIRRLIRRYEQAMRGIPETYFTEAARTIPGDSCALAAETVAELAAQAPTGIITLGIDIVARAYLEEFRTDAGPSLRFFGANTILFGPGPAGTRVFERYDPSALMLAGEDKRLALERRMAEFGAAVPTTIGHSEQDVPLARLSRERGGLAIGFNPTPALEDAFDVVVRGRDWEPLYALLAILAGLPLREAREK
jgi:phosphoserine phosphatase